jgi:hypothetical protein
VSSNPLFVHGIETYHRREQVSRRWFFVLLPFLIAWSGCGSNKPPGGNPGGGNVTPAVVNVTGGSSSPAINIVVPAPASSPTPNATALGVGGTVAVSTGDVIQRGTAPTVLIFGQGISKDMQISISGPNDITISNPVSIKATDGTPGVSFTATVRSNAAVSARTVIMQDSKGDITTFTGGLEVQ